MSLFLADNPDEPHPRDLIQLLDPSGQPSMNHTRVKRFISYDRHEELWEVLDTFNQVRVIAAKGNHEWLEVWI